MHEKTPNQRLNEYREEVLHLGYEEFAKRVGVHQMTARRWESGACDIDRKTALRIAGAFGLSADWLMFGTGTPVAEELTIQAKIENLISVPILSTRPYAGDGDFLEDYVGAVGSRTFDMRWLFDSFEIEPRNICLVNMPDDSMEPTIMADEALFVEGRCGLPEYENGLWALRLGDALSIRRVRRLASGQYLVLSDNPDFRQEGPADELFGSVQLLGRVVGGPPKRF